MKPDEGVKAPGVVEVTMGEDDLFDVERSIPIFRALGTRMPSSRHQRGAGLAAFKVIEPGSARVAIGEGDVIDKDRKPHRIASRTPHSPRTIHADSGHRAVKNFRRAPSAPLSARFISRNLGRVARRVSVRATMGHQQPGEDLGLDETGAVALGNDGEPSPSRPRNQDTADHGPVTFATAAPSAETVCSSCPAADFDRRFSPHPGFPRSTG